MVYCDKVCIYERGYVWLNGCEINSKWKGGKLIDLSTSEKGRKTISFVRISQPLEFSHPRCFSLRHFWRGGGGGGAERMVFEFVGNRILPRHLLHHFFLSVVKIRFINLTMIKKSFFRMDVLRSLPKISSNFPSDR